MWKLILICIVMTSVRTEAAKHYRKRYVGSSAGSYAGSGGHGGGYVGGYAGNGGYNGGYTGSYAGDHGVGGYFGTGAFTPDYPGIVDPFEFHRQHTAFILAQQAAQQSALASTFSSGDAYVDADASDYPDDTYEYSQHPSASAFRRQSLYNRGSPSHRYAPNFAAASGSIGPGGYHQTAYINPANPNIPNISNRFSPSSGSGSGGYKGVSVSSFSSSVDGVNRRGAQTTINDNGKVTSYRVHS